MTKEEALKVIEAYKDFVPRFTSSHQDNNFSRNDDDIFYYEKLNLIRTAHHVLMAKNKNQQPTKQDGE